MENRDKTQIFKTDLEEAKQRVEAWWDKKPLDRAVVQIQAPRKVERPYTGPDTDNLDDYWTNPDFVLPRLEHSLQNTAFLGEAMPVIYPVSTGLVSITNKYLGAPNTYIDKHTSWSGHIIDDLKYRPVLRFDEKNLWWKKTVTLMEAANRLIDRKRYQCFTGMPDLNGPTEVLSGLRGPQEFSVDFYDCPEAISPALREVQDAWFEAYRRTRDLAHVHGGYFNWMRVWSDLPMIDLQSDVSCLISREMFDEYFLPFIEEQTREIDRTIYHLDGPDAVRHLDSLLGIPGLNGIQWIQGAGAGRASEWIDLLLRIQEGDKLIWINAEPDEVLPLLNALDRNRVMVLTRCHSEEEGLELLRQVERL